MQAQSTLPRHYLLGEDSSMTVDGNLERVSGERVEENLPSSTWQLDLDVENEQELAPSKWGVIAREEFQGRTGPAITSPSGTICIALAAPALYRLQLRTRSCDIWFPQKLVAGLEAGFGFIIRNIPKNPSLAVAMDASCLCHLGQEFGDTRFLKAGLELYVKGLELLRRQLELPADRQNKANVGTVLTLQIIEAFTNLDYTGSGWMLHSKGLTALLDNTDIGGEIESHPPGYAELVGCSFYLFHFWSGLTERKRIRALGLDGGTVLTSIAERVPEALEMADSSCQKGVQLSLQEGVRIINMLRSIEHELNAWTASWNPCMRNSPFHVVDSAELFHYQSLPGQRLRSPFPLSMKFRKFFDAHDHMVCTASFLVIREAMIDVSRTLLQGQHKLDGSFGKQVRALNASANSCADSLCMAIPYLLLPSHGKYGHVLASHPLRVATRWYARIHREQSGEVSQKLSWCDQVAQRIRQRGIRPL